MKRLTKILICLILCVFAFGLAACGKKAIMHPDSAAQIYSNGGLAVKKGDYLYFVNGYLSANSMTERDAHYKVGSIVVAKLDANGNLVVNQDGSLDAGNCATLTDKLAGFEATNLNIFGDYLYFTSPCQENEGESWAKELVVFFRIKLDGTKKAEKIYQSTSKNSELEYSYYFDNKDVYLVVYEKAEGNKKLVIVNSNKTKNKFTVEGISNTAVPTNNSSSVMYVKNVDGKSEVHSLEISSKNDVLLGNETIDVKFCTPNYFLFEQSTEFGGEDKYLYKLAIDAKTINDKSVCWQSINNFSKYILTQDCQMLIGVRGNTVYKCSWQNNSNVEKVLEETESINLIGATDNTIYYYSADAENSNNSVLKSYNFTNKNASIKTIKSLENLDTEHFDINEDYLYFYKTVGNNKYLHRLQLSNNNGDLEEQFVGIYLNEDIPAQEEN